MTTAIPFQSERPIFSKVGSISELVDITYPADFKEKVKETILTKIGIELPSMTENELMHLSEKERRVYEHKLKVYNDWFCTLLSERQIGYRIGLREKVKEMLDYGVSLNEISRLTGQSVQQLNHLLSTQDEDYED